VHLACWISPYYGPFSLGRHFEIYEPFISLFFKKKFSRHVKLQITESADMGAHLCLCVSLPALNPWHKGKVNAVLGFCVA
jgi:hypothetical protein